MRRLVSGMALSLCLALSLAPQADAHMSAKTGRLKLIGLVQADFENGVRPGGTYPCVPRTPHYVRCDILFTDEEGEAWCGNGWTKLYHGRGYVSYYNVSMRDCRPAGRAAPSQEK